MSKCVCWFQLNFLQFIWSDIDQYARIVPVCALFWQQTDAHAQIKRPVDAKTIIIAVDICAYLCICVHICVYQHLCIYMYMWTWCKRGCCLGPIRTSHCALHHTSDSTLRLAVSVAVPQLTAASAALEPFSKPASINLCPDLRIRVGIDSHLSSISAFSTELKRIPTPLSLFSNFWLGADKTF